AWYPGQAAGTALADVLFGDYNPAGRLPVTFYQSVDQLPTFEDYTMKGKTYRYFGGDPLYTFGYGLSYTTFSYSGLKLPETVKPGDTVPVAVTVQNTGDLAGEEVVQFYVSDVDASAPVPIRSLKGFERIALKPGEKRVVEFSLSPKQLSLINNDLKRVIEPGIFEVSVGGMQPGGARTTAVVTTEVITGRFEVTGKVTEVNNGL
ncbi:MAG: glycoside hydrolase family 3 C-terminal domain-containing protein, partial [Candidatus Latescibacteria bacterium]|nr:glycoside hydrolase family 3 C-terminal domain-containing protein [Candidatus Latescibacterota bacterium]